MIFFFVKSFFFFLETGCSNSIFDWGNAKLNPTKSNWICIIEILIYAYNFLYGQNYLRSINPSTLTLLPTLLTLHTYLPCLASYSHTDLVPHPSQDQQTHQPWLKPGVALLLLLTPTYAQRYNLCPYSSSWR